MVEEFKGNSHGKGKGKTLSSNEMAKVPVSRSSRSGLQFPVGRIHRKLKEAAVFRFSRRVSKEDGSVKNEDGLGRVGGTAAVYCAAFDSCAYSAYLQSTFYCSSPG